MANTIRFHDFQIVLCAVFVCVTTRYSLIVLSVCSRLVVKNNVHPLTADRSDQHNEMKHTYMQTCHIEHGLEHCKLWASVSITISWIHSSCILCEHHVTSYTFSSRTTPGIARAYFIFVCKTGFQNMQSDTKLTVKDATDAKPPRIRRIRNLNPMGDVPDQDSAKNPENQFQALFCLPEQSLVLVYCSCGATFCIKFHKNLDSLKSAFISLSLMANRETHIS